MKDKNRSSVAWGVGRWTNAPVAVNLVDDNLVVTAAKESDAWRTTSYGFVHDTEHALLVPFEPDSGLEVSFMADFDDLFDQAGIFVRASDDRWIKAGLEFSDGTLFVGAVVTDRMSDWSVAPVPNWLGTEVTVRISWSRDALTIRAKSGSGDYQFVRLVPWSADVPMEAGPYLCAPTRAGLEVTFTSFVQTAPDKSLH